MRRSSAGSSDLSAPDPTSVLNLFGLIPWDYHVLFAIPLLGALVHFLSIGVWPLIMGFTMWAQMRLNPTPPDPVQARIFALMPFIFTFMLAPFAAGLVIYWAWNNTLSIAQQRLIMWRMGGEDRDGEGLTMAAPKASDGAWLFAQECRFVAGTETLERLPPPGLPEVAFAGRSNVGKSSLLNALTGRNAPGARLQHAGPHAADQLLRSRRPPDAGRPAGPRLCQGLQVQGQGLDQAGRPLSPRPAEPAPRPAAGRRQRRHQGRRRDADGPDGRSRPLLPDRA